MDTAEFGYDDDYDDEYGAWTCTECNGEGQVLCCIDDMCHGLDYCIHGDGYATCPACKGSGEIEPPDEEPN